MTEEILDRAYKLNKEIKFLKSFLRAYDSDSFYNIIMALDFGSERVILNNEPELYKYIREYFANKLEVLEQEFTNLNYT